MCQKCTRCCNTLWDIEWNFSLLTRITSKFIPYSSWTKKHFSYKEYIENKWSDHANYLILNRSKILLMPKIYLPNLVDVGTPMKSTYLKKPIFCQNTCQHSNTLTKSVHRLLINDKLSVQFIKMTKVYLFIGVFTKILFKSSKRISSFICLLVFLL